MKHVTCALAVVMLLSVALCALSSKAQTNRLVERDLTLKTVPSHLASGDDVPIVDPPKRIAGYFKLNRTHEARMFYFFFESRQQKRDDPVVLWMTGGPGCSSEIAIFEENGPYTVNPNMTLSETAYGWDATHNMIFVDQPINVGFSYSHDPADTVTTEKGVADDMLDFLQAFFAAHPDLAHRDFFVTGESFAGHYVPAVAKRVWRAGKEGEGAPINLKGLAIGNGLTDPSIQFGAYADFALQNSLISRGLHDIIQLLYQPCKWLTNICGSYKWGWECAIALQYCEMTVFQPILMAQPGINVYDIRKPCVGQLCYDFSAVEKYLNLPDTRAALGVGDIKWQSCSTDVYMDFLGDFMRKYDEKLLPLLADGLRVLIYAGDQDLICNWLGNQRWVDELQWVGAAEWAQARERPWQVDGRVAGSVKSAGPLWFVKVAAAGHMVPMDQPRAALQLITRFTRNETLNTADPTEQPKPHHTFAKRWSPKSITSLVQS